ncbi:pilin [Zooshikella ganghwensis]|nr:pilin [Zooshikella ganghwensis]
MSNDSKNYIFEIEYNLGLDESRTETAKINAKMAGDNVTLTVLSGPKPIKNKTILFKVEKQNDNKVYICSGGSIENKYLPSSCKK